MAHHKKHRSFVPGAILISIGTLLFFDQLGVLEFGHVISTYWPLFLVLVGIRIMFFPKERSEKARADVVIDDVIESKKAHTGSLESETTLNASQVFGDIRRKLNPDDFVGGRCSTVFGDIDIDATNISLGTGQRTLYLNGVFGDIRLKLPDNIPLLVRANATAGDIDIKSVRGDGLFIQRSYKTADFESAGTRLIVVASVLFGDIRVW